MDFFDVVSTQRAIRRLTSDPIPDDVIRRLLETAIRAPSGGNRQGWSFVVVKDAALRVVGQFEISPTCGRARSRGTLESCQNA